MNAAARLRRDLRGGVGILVAAGLPMLLGATALAVDLGAAALDTRRLQGLADAAALAAAADPSDAQLLAEGAVAISGWTRPIKITAVAGDYAQDAAVAPDARFTARNSATDAVRVTVESATPTYFARMFGRASIPIARRATAARERLASFSVGTRLAAVNGGLLNAYLSALTGSAVSLSVADYNALADADVDLFGALAALRTTAHLQAGTFDDVLNAQVTYAQAFDALAQATASTDAANALRALAVQVPGGGIKLRGLIDAGPLGAQASGGSGLAMLGAMSFATGILQIGNGNRQVALDLGAGVAGLASTRLTIAIGERPAQSPWLAITANGTPVLRTAQARVYLEARLANLALPGIGTLIGIKLPLYTELASAQARLSGVDCSTAASRGVTIEAMPSPGQAAIAALDPARLADFTAAVPLSTAKLVDTALIDIESNTRIDLGAAEQWQALRFDTADIAAMAPHTASSSAPVQGIAASLIAQANLTARVIGLPIPVTPLLQAVGTALAAVAPAVDGLLDAATGSLGVHYGQADVRVTGMRCGTSALVG